MKNYLNSFTTVFTLLLVYLICLSPQPALGEDCQSEPIPGGGTITFSSDRDGDWEIYAMEGSECNIVKLTDNTFKDNLPAISPDGTKIAFVSNRDGWNSEIFVMDIDGSNVIQLTNTKDPYHSGHPWHSSPEWSPDGTKIAYTEGPAARNAQVRIMNSDGTGQRLLANSPSDCGIPDWINNYQVAFESRECSGCSNNYRIDVMNIDETGRHTLVDTNYRELAPRFSLDGSQFVFTSDRDENPQRKNDEVYIRHYHDLKCRREIVPRSEVQAEVV